MRPGPLHGSRSRDATAGRARESASARPAQPARLLALASAVGNRRLSRVLGAGRALKVLDAAAREMVRQARQRQREAMALKSHFKGHRLYEDKCFAMGGPAHAPEGAMSGWEHQAMTHGRDPRTGERAELPARIRWGEEAKTDVLKSLAKSGHTLEERGARDQGFPGQAAASHAEKAVAVQSEAPIGVTEPICPDCGGFLGALARATKTVRVVAAPDREHLFDEEGRHWSRPSNAGDDVPFEPA